MKYKIVNNSDSSVGFENEVHSLCGFAQDRLGFKKPPAIVLDGDNQNAGKVLAKTGYYDPNTMEIHVFITGRHPKDILRSIAHELVHHNQHENGELEKGSYTGKGYAQKDPHLRKMELQANDPMLFRDWEDSLKEKHPTIYNERRNRKMSIKDWKNKEIGTLLTEKWGFKMDLSKLSEGMGAHADDPMGGMQSQEMHPEPPMSNAELGLEECMREKMADGMTMEEANFACMREMDEKPPPMPGKMERDVPFQEGKKITHMCALEVIHKRTGKKGHPIAHTLTESGRISHYSVEFDNVIVEHIPVGNLKIIVQEEHSHKRDDEKPHDKNKKKMSEKELEEAEKPDFPDVDGDGDREEPISKAQKDKKEKGGDEEESSDKPKKGKMPKGLADYHAKKGGKKKEELDEMSSAGGGAAQGHVGKKRRTK